MFCGDTASAKIDLIVDQNNQGEEMETQNENIPNDNATALDGIQDIIDTLRETCSSEDKETAIAALCW